MTHLDQIIPNLVLTTVHTKLCGYMPPYVYSYITTLRINISCVKHGSDYMH